MVTKTPTEDAGALQVQLGTAQSRPLRSYVLRQGRMSNAQRRAYDQLLARFAIAYSPAPIDLAVAFERAAPTILEVGFGMGETTTAIARAHPEHNYLGVEVHSPGVGSLLKQIAELGLTNVRIIQHDAVEVVEHMLVPGCLAGIHIFFPDPWPKKRHRKRRLIQPPFLHLLATRLRPDGCLHMATDWEDYAMQMLEVAGGEPLLTNTADGFALGPGDRPPTKFEGRGRKLGHFIRDLVFRRER
jgi:tRNA (guanine-N7-)-methyltransferase